MSSLDKARAKHNVVVDNVSKLALKRDKALDALIRAQARYRDAIKSVSRSSKRMDKLREQIAQVKAAKAARRKEDAPPTLSAEDVLGI